MLYTVVALDDIFYQPPPDRVARQAGAHCFLELTGGRICAVKSTDPADYLKYAIGQTYPHAE